jgi:aminopeptidase S
MTGGLLSQRNLSGILVAAALFFAGACDDSTAPSAITLAVAPTSVTVTRGNETGSTATVTVTRSESFEDSDFPAVLLSAEGLPTGVTVTFSPVAPTGATSTMTVKATTEATNGTYNVTIRGQGSNINPNTTSVSIVVSG